MVQYEYLVRDALDKLKEYAANLRKKLEAGAPAAELLLETRSLKLLFENFEKIVPAPVRNVSNMARHLSFMERNFGKDFISGSEGDIKDICDHDLPQIETAFRKWASDPTHFDQELADGVTELVMRQENDSAIRKAFVILKARLVRLFGAPKELDGADLMNWIFGKNGPLSVKLDDAKRQAFRDLLAGLYGVVRNKYAHHDASPMWSETDAVVAMVNYLLKELKGIAPSKWD